MPLPSTKRSRCSFKIKDKEIEFYQYIKDEVRNTGKPFEHSNSFLATRFGCSIKSISLMISSLKQKDKIRVYVGATKGKNNPLTWRVIQVVNTIHTAPQVVATHTKVTMQPKASKKIIFNGKEITLSKESIDRAFLGKTDKRAEAKVVEDGIDERGAVPASGKLIKAEPIPYASRFKTVPFELKDLTNGMFPVGLDLNNHPVAKDLLKSAEIPYWNRWKEEISGYAPRQDATLIAVISILDRMKEIIVSRYGKDYTYDSKELAERTSNKIIEFYGAK